MPYVILVLEDDSDLRTALVRTLEDEDYLVYAAANGQEALALAGTVRFDMAVADVRMQGPDGLEVLRQLKQHNRALLCVVMTGFAGDDAPVRAMQIQVDDYIFKPFKKKDLLATIQRLEHRRRDEARYDGMFARVLEGYSRMLSQTGTTATSAALTQIEEARDVAWRSFFVGVRSGKVSVPEGIQVWDLMEQAEARRDAILDAPPGPPEAYQRLFQGYRYINDLVAALSQSTLSQRPRGPERVAYETYEQLHASIRRGLISLTQLKRAPALRRADPLALATDPELRSLSEQIWQH